MAADFKPTLDGYKDLKPFVFWAQTTLPTVFDDSLSYYEVLTKLTKMVNVLLENTDTAEHNIEALVTVFGQLQEYVNHYFDSLDVSAEVDAKLDTMVEDGTLDDIIQPIVEHYTSEVIDDVVHAQLSAVVAEQIGGEVANQIDAAIAPQITPKVNSYLAANLPQMVADEVPLAVGEQIDPAVGVLLPSVVNEQLPNAVSTEMVSALPPVVQSQLPGVVATQIPGAVSSQMPAVLAPIATQQIQTLVPNWLATHIHNPSSPPLDDTLGLKNCAAESWYVGRRFFDLQGSPTTMEEDKKVVYQTGEVVEAEHWLTFTATVSDKFPVSVGYPHFDLTQDPVVDWTYAYYDADGVYITDSGNTWEGFINWSVVTAPVPEGAATIKFSIQSDAADFISDDLAVLVFANGAQIIDAINAALENINVNVDIDDTLTQSGKAADAKATGDAINELKNALDSEADTIGQISGNRPLTWYTGRFSTQSTSGIGETVNFVQDSAYRCVKFPCTEGDKFTLHAGGPSGITRAWFMVDADMVCIDRSTTNMSSQVTITAKPGTAFILCNNQLSKMASGFFAYKGVPSIAERVTDCETAAFGHYSEDVPFVQGTLTSSGAPNNSNTRIRSSQYIPISNLIKAICSENGQLTIFGYDVKRVFIARITTPRTIWSAEDIAAAIPGTQFVRFVFAAQGSPEITPADAETYGLHCYAAPFTNPSFEPLTNDTIKPYLNESGELTSTLNYKFSVAKADVVNKIFSIRAKYSGETAPAFRLYAYAPNGVQTLAGPYMQFLSKDEFITQEFRLPNDYSITAYQINLNIPAGSKMIVQDCSFFNDDYHGYGDCGVTVDAHRGLDCIFPGDSYDGIVAAGKCGFKYCITIPKFTADGVAVCFHNDGVPSSPLSEQLSLEDGSAIPGMTDTSKISDYTYAELMQWSIGATKNAVYAGCKILKLDDFFGICSKFGMHPVLSIHPAPSLEQWEQIKAMTDKWGLTPYLSVKSGDYSVTWRRVITTFGDGAIERIINIYSTTSTYDILDWISTGMQTAGIEKTPVTTEFYDASLSSETYGDIQKEQLDAAVAAGIHTSVVLQSNTDTAKMHEYIDMGVTEFTNGRFVNNGMLW